jgi:2-hydroxycyclohexanecarboxyl-CoA dehydrogenase
VRSSLFDLGGRVALVPGASGGIGGAVARVLAECGADVALGYAGNQAAAQAAACDVAAFGVRARVDRIDATDAAAVAGWTASVIAEYGQIDILANCVGSQGNFQLVRDQTPEQWAALIGQHFTAGVILARAVMDHMVERGAGRIINLSSDGAKSGQSGAAVANGASAGLVAFGKSLAREISRYGVTVNAVCPGPTKTPLLEAMMAGGDTGAKLVAAAIRAIPMKRPGEAREVAAAFAFLASDAGSYITGQALSVSGGLTMV